LSVEKIDFSRYTRQKYIKEETHMSRQLIEYSLDNGKSIFVEERCSDEVRRGESEASFQEAMETAKDATEVIIKQIDRLKSSPNCPEEIDVEFGIKLGAKMMLSSLDGEVDLKITLKWKK
jgi:hypothetical protein